MELGELKNAIYLRRFKITMHGAYELEKDQILIDEIIFSISTFEILELYPKSKPYPAVLILSFNSKNEPLHTVWAYDMFNKYAVLITAYRPMTEKWVKSKIRKK